jgi:hypothetical protein
MVLMKSKNALLIDEPNEPKRYKFYFTSSSRVARKRLGTVNPDAVVVFYVVIIFSTLLVPQIRLFLPLLAPVILVLVAELVIMLMLQSDLKTALRMEEDQRKIAEALAYGIRLTDPSEPKQVFMGDDGEFVFPISEDNPLNH